MIDLELRGQLTDHLFSMLEGLRDPDPIKLAMRCREILIEENERGLKAGMNADGTETAELRPSTIERGRGGFGPPRIPRFSSSRLISGFQVAVAAEGEHGYVIRAGWPGLDFVRYINDGTTHMVARPVAGIRPTTRSQLEEATHKHGGDMVTGGRR